MSQKLLDDLKSDISSSYPKVADRIAALVRVLADRVASLGGDAVKASDLATTLRLDPDSLGDLIATNPPEVELAPASLNPAPEPVKPVEPVKPADAPATGSQIGGNANPKV